MPQDLCLFPFRQNRKELTLLLHYLGAFYLPYLQLDLQGPRGVNRLKRAQLIHCLVKIPEVCGA